MSSGICAGECGLGPLPPCNLEGPGRKDRSPFRLRSFRQVQQVRLSRSPLNKGGSFRPSWFFNLMSHKKRLKINLLLGAINPHAGDALKQEPMIKPDFPPLSYRLISHNNLNGNADARSCSLVLIPFACTRFTSPHGFSRLIGQ